MKILFIRPIGHFNIVEEKCQDNSQAKENIYFILSFYNLFPTYYRANIPPKIPSLTPWNWALPNAANPLTTCNFLQCDKKQNQTRWPQLQVASSDLHSLPLSLCIFPLLLLRLKWDFLFGFFVFILHFGNLVSGSSIFTATGWMVD